MAISRATACRSFAKASPRLASSAIHERMVLSGTPYRRATAQMEPLDSMAASTSARTFGGYFCPRRVPFTVFLQYARFATAAASPLWFFPPSLQPPEKQNYCGHLRFWQHKKTGSPQPHHAIAMLWQRYNSTRCPLPQGPALRASSELRRPALPARPANASPSGRGGSAQR